MQKLLPAKNAAFQGFVAPARPYDEAWRTIVGIILIFALWAAQIALVLVGAAFFWPEILELPAADGSASRFGSLGTLAIFVLVYPALWLVLRLLHRRKVTSLLGASGRVDWRAFAKALAIIAALAGLQVGLTLYMGEAVAGVNLHAWLAFAPIVVVLVFFQTAAEELIFRGYLLQQLGSRFSSSLIWLYAPILIFAAMHWDHNTFGTNAPLVVGATFLMGLIFTDLAVRSGNLGASMGLHFGNNLIAILILSAPGPLSGLALYRSDVDLSDVAAIRSSLIVQIVLMLVLYAIYLFVATRRRAGQLQIGTADLN